MKLEKIILMFLSTLVLSSDKQLYSTLQMMDQVMVIDPVTLQINESVSSEFGEGMENTNSDVMNTPHFIALDEINGYWFVTTITSGYVAQFSLLDNQLIDTYFVGDAPALLAVDAVHKKVYCSRMMPMNSMGDMMPGSESTLIQSLH